MDRLTDQQATDVRRIAAAAIRLLGPQAEIGGTVQDEIEHIQANLDDIKAIERTRALS